MCGMCVYVTDCDFFYFFKSQFIKSAVIVGTFRRGRFGISIANLGDLNNDGFEGSSLSLSLSLSLSHISFS